ncbi:hypothetical protein MMC30_005669 [Trapelia coarctata]|nr:hypothetical protein [Trapelia coarctata]
MVIRGSGLTCNRRFFTFSAGEQHIVDQRLHEKYGPVVRIGPNSLLFSDTPAFESIYGFNKGVEKGEYYVMTGDRDPKKGPIFALHTDKQHRERSRKIVSTALTLKHVTSYEPIVSKNFAVFLERLGHAADLSSSTFNIVPYVRRFTFDTVSEMVYGTSMDFQSAKEDDVIAAHQTAYQLQNITKLAFWVPLVPWLGRLLSSPFIRPLLRRPTFDENGSPTGFTRLLKMVESAIGSDVGSTEPRDTILQNFRRVKADGSRRLEGEELWKECFNFLFAGPASTAAALLAILYHLGTHPEAQTRLFDEIKVPESNQAANSLFLDRVIKESLRLSPPFPSVFPRYIRSGAENIIPNLPTPLPAGTMVGCNVYALGRSKDIWGDDANEWRPERWMQDPDDADGKVDRKMREAFAVFGRGSRACKGKDIAWMLLSEAVFGICSKWEVVAKPGSLRGKNAFEMQYGELMVELKPRQGSVV